ncbi:phosphohexomutase domain-containing protein [Enterococcus hermanniensis]|uniref:Phosphoglucomutase/phosphomannomutase n=1 Tax=Enterococcus hermanniensis TaxID=249189 RepID=A0A1L8TS67_9ENTE|nr:phosphomannomutase/phosphoglucomutase [Enterococcus hermanniensis]OJG47165.1 phosphoglucomutase/phosphomannomutase [Enterococcus hermanniensis]
MELTKLQNGSDIRGIAITDGEKIKNLGTEEIRLIAQGILNWLENKGVKRPFKIGIGHDSRLTGPALKNVLIEVFEKAGCEVLDFGLATTPALFMATQFDEFKCDAGIMLTASHLPYYFNGIKIFSQSGGAEKSDIAFILAHTTASEVATGAGTVKKADLLSRYAKDLVEKIQQGSGAEQPLKGLKIVVDAGNGAGGYFAANVLAVLGADTTGSQFLEPDGHFPNHIPNPDNKEAMASIKKAVLTNQADLGVIFDTDVDRSAIVSKDGQMINRNNLIAVLSAIVLQEHPGSTIVTNSPTSDHLKKFIEEKGGKQYRYISGYRNVINKAIELNNEGIDCQLAIETSSHAAFKENYFLDDGAYVIAKVLMLLPKLQQENRELTDLMAELAQPKETLELRYPISGENYQETGQKMIERFQVELAQQAGFTVNPENQEGIRFSVEEPFGVGWLLLRLSLHEPLLVMQVENDQVGQIQKQLPIFRAILAQDPQIDSTKLAQQIN